MVKEDLLGCLCMYIMVSGQLPLRKIAPRLGLGFSLGLELVLVLGEIFLGGNYPKTICNT